MVARPGKKRKAVEVDEATEEVKVDIDEAFQPFKAAQLEVSKLAARIRAEREELEQRKAEMLSASLLAQGIKQERDSLLSLRPSSIVKLNVGGTKIDVKRSTVTSFPSKLKWMLSGRWDHVYKHDSEGRILLDYDAGWVEPIINHLRELAIQASPVPMEPPKMEGEDEVGFKYLTRVLGLEQLFVRDESAEGLLKSWMRPFMSKNIVSAIGTGKERCDFKLLYRASRDGFSIGRHTELCKGEVNTVTIVRDEEGNVFGGFVDVARSFDSKYSGTGKAFLFKLSSGGKQDPACLDTFPQMDGKEESAIFNDPQAFAVFGEGHDLYISNTCASGMDSRCNLGSTYECVDGQKHELTGGKENFKVVEMEVWKASLELDEAKNNPCTAERIPTDCQCSLRGLTTQLDAMEAFQHELLKEGVELCREAHALGDEVEDLGDEKEYMEELAEEIKQEEVVFFNVGGRKLYTMKQTLELVKDSKLYKQYASGQGKVPEGDLDDDGDIFLDVNPYCFGKIVSHLRMRRLHAKLGKNVQGLPKALLQVGPAHEASFKRMLGFFDLEWSTLEGLFDVDDRLPDSAFAKYYAQLQPHLPGTTADTKLRLMWRGSKDGYQAASVTAKLRQLNPSNQVVMVKDREGNAFGGYTNSFRPEVRSGFIPAPGSFLFSLQRKGLTHEESFKICQLNGSAEQALSAAGGHIYNFGQNDLLIVTGCDRANSRSDIGGVYCNHGVQRLLTSGAATFQVQELEIWTYS